MRDYCSFWFDRLWGYDWSTCCLQHDVDYGLGIDKLGADVALAQCVAGVAGWPMAVVMFLGVFAGGVFFFKRRK